MGSFFRNWHKPSAWYRTTKKALCDTWWPKVSHHANTMMEITFTAGEANQQITFVLTAEHTAHLYKQLTEKIGEKAGLAGTNMTAVTSAETPHSLDGNIILTIKDGKVDIQVYKLPVEQAAVVLRSAAAKF